MGCHQLPIFLVQTLSGFYSFSLATLASILFATLVICIGAYYSSRNGAATQQPDAMRTDESSTSADEGIKNAA